MPRFPVVLRGYDQTQVDALIARIEAALRESAGGLTAEDVRRTRFAVVLRGYDQRVVDEALHEYIRRLHARAPLADRPRRPRVHAGWLISWIQSVQFAGAGMRAGYDVRDVDAFLERVIAGLRGTAPPITARDVRECAFRTVRFGHGYDEREVDRFLTQLASALDTPVPR
jgi:DivIVA domain-containing protein